jgi:hypothetical protein
VAEVVELDELEGHEDEEGSSKKEVRKEEIEEGSSKKEVRKVRKDTVQARAREREGEETESGSLGGWDRWAQ